MSNAPHPATPFIEPLKDLAEGRTEPAYWLAWWVDHDAQVKAAVLPGWYLKLKPRNDPSEQNRSALLSQEGARVVLDALNVDYVSSDRYQKAWKLEFEQYCADQKAKEKELKKKFAPGIARLSPAFPKLARFLKKIASDVERLDEPADLAELSDVEKSLGKPLPKAVRTFFEATRSLRLEGLSISLDEIQAHPALVCDGVGSVCIAEYWLEGDGDQVVIANDSMDDDPRVFYYAHGNATHTASKLADSFSKWIESLPKSPIFEV